ALLYNLDLDAIGAADEARLAAGDHYERVAGNDVAGCFEFAHHVLHGVGHVFHEIWLTTPHNGKALVHGSVVGDHDDGHVGAQGGDVARGLAGASFGNDGFGVELPGQHGRGGRDGVHVTGRFGVGVSGQEPDELLALGIKDDAFHHFDRLNR